jgi:hypothetical protein
MRESFIFLGDILRCLLAAAFFMAYGAGAWILVGAKDWFYLAMLTLGYFLIVPVFVLKK